MHDKISKFDMVKRIKEKLKDKRIPMPANGTNKMYTNIIIENVIDAFLDSAVEAISDGDKIAFREYFSIEPDIYEEKKWKNPKNQKQIIIPTHYIAKAHFGSKFKLACKYLTEKEWGRL